ncbi:putative RNA-directed DNA polymerase from transposon BS [Trichonephila clavipes]|nr:putative RNA-directed DNA polymerase from transposon BS [Trichonephila clavipes]
MKHGCRSDTQRGTSIFNRDFRVNELETAIGDSCLNKSSGPDGIHSQMISHLGLSGRQRLLDITNCSVPESYRPIALTSIAYKIMEKMVLRRLTFHLHSHNLLPEEQCGFREGQSTTDQLLYFCQRIRHAQNRKPTNHTAEVRLDLSKGFDKVWRFTLFQGVPQGSVLIPALISLYLSGIERVIKRKCEVGAFVVDVVL